MRNIVNVNKRHLIRFCLAFGVAVIVNYYSFTQGWWLPLAAAFVMLTNTGSALYQGVLRYVLLLVLVGGGSWIVSDAELMHFRVYDITLGALVGIAVNVLVLPDRIDIAFRKSVTPVLEKYSVYFQAIVSLLLNQQKENADKKKLAVEKALQNLPTWVYEAGFDLTLQKGYRFFLMKVSELSEILFSIHHLARYPFSLELLGVITEPLVAAVGKSDEFFVVLIRVFNLLDPRHELVNFYEEIDIMHNNFKKIMPANLEVIDISKDYVYLIELVYLLREFQDVLMKMAEALREV